MRKPSKTVREVEALLGEAIRERYPTTPHVGLLRRRGRGWRCFIGWRLVEHDRIGPLVAEAEQLLAELAERFEIIEG